jgi:hypothetical protein
MLLLLLLAAAAAASAAITLLCVHVRLLSRCLQAAPFAAAEFSLPSKLPSMSLRGLAQPVLLHSLAAATQQPVGLSLMTFQTASSCL